MDNIRSGIDKARVGNLGIITRIFERRYYLQAFMDVVLAGFGSILTLVAFYIYKGIDAFFNFIIPDATIVLSRYIRSIQRGGYLRTYLEVLLLTLAVVILIILIIITLL